MVFGKEKGQLKVLSEAWHVFSEPAHAIAEIWSTMIEALLISPIIAWGLRRHDRRKHKLDSIDTEG